MKRNILFLLVFLSLSLSSCAEKVDIKIVSPAPNYRFTDPYTEGSAIPIPVSVYYKGTEKEKIAVMRNVNTGESYGCTLISGRSVACGGILISKLGGQVIEVLTYKKTGEQVSDQVTFRWEPYQGLEKVAYDLSGVVGEPSAPMGFLYLSLLAILVFFALVIILAVKSNYTLSHKKPVTMLYENVYTGDKVTITSQGERFLGAGQFDPALGRTSEQQAFVLAVNAFESKEDRKKIFLSQPDKEKLLEKKDW